MCFLASELAFKKKYFTIFHTFHKEFFATRLFQRCKNLIGNVKQSKGSNIFWGDENSHQEHLDCRTF